MYDVIIIGAGVVGCAVARFLSKYRVKVCVLEKSEDVCAGTSKANSAIVHAGFDAAYGTKMAEYNVLGSRMMPELAKELNFDYQQNGSLVLCFSEEDMPRLEKLRENGEKNGVQGLEILSGERVKEMEPNLSDKVVAALWAPTGAIVCPFGLTTALAENAAANEVEFIFNTKVTHFIKSSAGWTVCTENGTYDTRYVVNAAGVYADILHNMVSNDKIHIVPRKGEYYLLDHTAGSFVSHTIFRLPGAKGKGVLISPTVHGNLLLGPTANDIDDREATNTTRSGLDEVAEKAAEMANNIPIRNVITSFAGLRAHEDGHEFIIGEVTDAPQFIDCAGIESPGLSASPAIGKAVAEYLARELGLAEKQDFIPNRKGYIRTDRLSEKELNEQIERDPAYGQIICRCESITEGEILDAIHRVPGAKSLDGVKRRVRAGMGRCQGGFCSPRVMELLSRELGVEEDTITKSGGSSHIVEQQIEDDFEMDSFTASHVHVEASVKEKYYDVVIIGGGPAGLAAALGAYQKGCRSILILERDKKPGGILNQCIHNGFGLHTFKEELTGPEYAQRYVEQVRACGIPIQLDTMVLNITKDLVITSISREHGVEKIRAGAIVLAMGCRERSRGALNIPGYRPAGIFSAGTAQRLVNMEGMLPGKKVVILGSGDIGLIMARRMVLSGAEVKLVAELLPYSGGLKRNIVQCLNDFDIPLKLSHTVVNIEGKERIEAITIAEVGPDRNPIPGTEERYECDTLLLSCGLIPENEVSRTAGVDLDPVTGGPIVDSDLQTQVPGIFAAGNVLHVHDLVDYVSEEAERAGACAADYAMNSPSDGKRLEISFEQPVRYVVPHTINTVRSYDSLTLRFRVARPMKNCRVKLIVNGEEVSSRRRQVMSPGEMEQVILTRAQLDVPSGLSEVRILVEEETAV